MAKKKKGNGEASEEVKKQFEFLEEVKKLAKKHGINMGPFNQPTVDPRQLRIQVREVQGKIGIDFGKSITWMSMDITQATKFAATIVKLVQGVQARNAIEAEGGESDLEAGQPADGEPDPDQDQEAEKEKVDKPK